MKTIFLNLNSMKTIRLFAMAIFAVTILASCSNDDDPVEVLEEEFWTEFTMTFTNTQNANDTVVLRVFDADGEPGPTAPVLTVTGNFTANATYNATLTLMNTIENEDVLNDDVIPEKDEHFFTFAVNGINLTVVRATNDIVRTDGEKLGVNTTWTAGAASTGNIQVRLVHEPATVDDSDEFGSTTGGSEDINVTFTGVVIQ